MEGSLNSCHLCSSAFDSVDVLRTHPLQDYGNGVSSETNEKVSHSGYASIADNSASCLVNEASSKISTLAAQDYISGLLAQTETVVKNEPNDCPLESNNPVPFPKQCFKEQISQLSYVKAENGVKDDGNCAATGPDVGLSSTQTVKYLDSSSSELRQHKFLEQQRFEKMGELELNKCHEQVLENEEIICRANNPNDSQKQDDEFVKKKRKGSHSGDASIEDTPVPCLIREASFEMSKLAALNNISGLPAQTETVVKTEPNDCPLESNDPVPFPKQCCKKQISQLSHVKAENGVKDEGNCVATGPEEGASSTPVKYLDSSSSLIQRGDTNGAQDHKELIHKTNGSSTDMTEVFQAEYEDGSPVLDDYERTRRKKKEKKGSCTFYLDIHVYKMPLCEECGISFRRKEQLQTHLDNHNRGITTVTESNCTDAEEMESVGHTDLPMREGAESVHVSNGDTKMEHFSECERKFGSNYQLKHHKCHGFVGEPKLPRYGCSVCSKLFVFSSHLKEHMMIHTGAYPYKCDACEQNFRRKNKLEQHQCCGRVHVFQNEKRVCPDNMPNNSEKQDGEVDNMGEREPNECHELVLEHEEIIYGAYKPNDSEKQDGELDKKEELKKNECHEQVLEIENKGACMPKEKFVDSELRRYGCSVCGKHFLRKEYLKQHMIIHTGAYPFKCNLCKRNFRRKFQLEQHKCHRRRFKTGKKMRVDNKTDDSQKQDGEVEKTKELDQKEYREQALESEKSTPTEHFRDPDLYKYGCSVCGKHFLRKDYLKQHMIIHTGAYPFKCNLCERKFRRKTELEQHQCCGRVFQNEKRICPDNKPNDSEKQDCEVENMGEWEPNKCHEQVHVLENEEIIYGANKPNNSEKQDRELDKKVELKKNECQEQVLEIKKKIVACTPKGKFSYPKLRRYGCSVCGKHFFRTHHLKEHMIIHTGAYPFKCDACKRNFMRKSKLEQHQCCGQVFQIDRRVCPDNKPNDSEKQDGEVEKMGEWEPNKCHEQVLENEEIICRANNPNDSEKQNGEFEKEELEKNECQEQMLKIENKGACTSEGKFSDPELRRYGCSVCGKHFIRKYHLKEHMILHTGAYPFKCDACKRNFMRKSKLEKHQCCGRVFQIEKKICVDNKTDDSKKQDGEVEKTKELDQKEYREQALESEKCTPTENFRDPDLYRYDCCVCGMRFIKETVLKKHMTLHSKVLHIAKLHNCLDPKIEKSKRRFRCSVCKKCFSQSDLLEEHMVTHTDGYLFKCDVCERKFKRNSELKQHNCQNENHGTNVSTITSSKKGKKLGSDMDNGSQLHVRRFQCGECGKYFIKNSHLKEHMIIHTKVYPFICDVCKRNFRRITELKKHYCLGHVQQL